MANAAFLIDSVPEPNYTESGFIPEKTILLSDGSYVVTWDVNGFYPTGEIFNVIESQRFNASGMPLSPIEMLGGDYGQDAYAALSTGGYLHLFENETSSIGNFHALDGAQLFLEKINQNDRPVGSPLLIETLPSTYHFPALTVMPNEDSVVAWENGNQIEAQRFNAALQKKGASFLIHTLPTGTVSDMKLISLQNNGFAAFWTFANGTWLNLYGQRFDSANNKVGAPFLVNSIPFHSESGLKLTRMAGGGFLVSWVTPESGVNNTAIIHLQRYDGNAYSLGNEIQVKTAYNATMGLPVFDVAALTNGGFVLNWNAQPQPNDNRSGNDFFQIFNASGHPASGPVQMPDVAFNPEISALPNGHFVQSWTDEFGSTLNSAIYNAYGHIVPRPYPVLMTGITDNFISGPGKNEIVVNNDTSESIWCKSGNDTVIGSDAGDVFVGGVGDNLLQGGTGNDTYRFYPGFGKDTIQDAGGWNRIQFAAGISASEIAIFRDKSNTLWIACGDNPNRQQITFQNAAGTGWVNNIQLADGDKLSGTNINALIQEMAAYTSSHHEIFHSIQDVENNPALMAMIHAAWHK